MKTNSQYSMETSLNQKKKTARKILNSSSWFQGYEGKRKEREIKTKTKLEGSNGVESYRIAILTHMTTAPGLWMHMVTILRLPTNFVDHVLRICGRNWKAESIMDDMPRSVVQIERAGERGETCCVVSRRKVTEVHKPLRG